MPRINVYHHETQWMADRGAEIVTKTVEDTGITFYGIRFYTEAVREHEPGDDDSAAITIWLPWTRADGHDIDIIARISENMIEAVNEITRQIFASNPDHPANVPDPPGA